MSFNDAPMSGLVAFTIVSTSGKSGQFSIYGTTLREKDDIATT